MAFNMGRYYYRAPETGSTYLRCAMCDRPFKTFRYRVREGAKFCTRSCFYAAMRAFHKALWDGRLEGILAPERERAKAERLQLLREKAWL
jgi:hypothetical protein